MKLTKRRIAFILLFAGLSTAVVFFLLRKKDGPRLLLAAPAGFLVPPEALIPQDLMRTRTFYSAAGYRLFYRSRRGPFPTLQIEEQQDDAGGRCKFPERAFAGSVQSKKEFAWKGHTGVVVSGAHRVADRNGRMSRVQVFKLLFNDGGKCLAIQVTDSSERRFSEDVLISFLQSFQRSDGTP